MVIININIINDPIKSHRLSDWIKAGYITREVVQLEVECLLIISVTKNCRQFLSQTNQKRDIREIKVEFVRKRSLLASFYKFPEGAMQATGEENLSVVLASSGP